MTSTTIKDILVYPDQQLKCLSEPITELSSSTQQFIDDLEATRRAGLGAVGIAAPQIGMKRRIVIVDVSKTRKPVANHGHLVLINPEITEWNEHEIGREGCLSVPDFTGNVIRAKQIHLKALDRDGKEIAFDMEGFEARAVQHEIDHLDGLLFLDRVVSRNTDVFKRKVYKK